mgnify:CR=1 FL=1
MQLQTQFPMNLIFHRKINYVNNGFTKANFGN